MSSEGSTEIKKEVKYEVDEKSDTERKMEDAGDKMKAGMRSAGAKIENPDRDLGTQYGKKKTEERLT
jgi:hypothetical protein